MTLQELKAVQETADEELIYIRMARLLDQKLFARILQCPKKAKEQFLESMQGSGSFLERILGFRKKKTSRDPADTEALLLLLQPLRDDQVQEVLQAYEKGIPLATIQKVIRPERSGALMRKIFQMLERYQ